MVTYKDMESEDYSLYQSLVYMLNNPVTDLGYEVSAIKSFQKLNIYFCGCPDLNNLDHIFNRCGEIRGNKNC